MIDTQKISQKDNTRLILVPMSTAYVVHIYQYIQYFGIVLCHLIPVFPWCLGKLANALKILQMRNFSKDWKRCSFTLLESSSAVGCRKHNMSLENCPSFSNTLDIPAPCTTKGHDQTQMLMFGSSSKTKCCLSKILIQVLKKVKGIEQG